MEEINSGHPREFLLETILRALRETFTGTPMELEAKEMAYIIYNYASSLPSDNIGGKRAKENTFNQRKMDTWFLGGKFIFCWLQG